MSTHPAQRRAPRDAACCCWSSTAPAATRPRGGFPARHPPSVLAPEHLRGAVLAAESAGFHAATFSDPGLPDADAGRPGPDAAARLNALQRAAFAGPVTRSLALIPEVDTVYTEPFHISTQLASLDYVSGGRAGWLVAASPAQPMPPPSDATPCAGTGSPGRPPIRSRSAAGSGTPGRTTP